MKLVFIDSGDSLDITVPKSQFVRKWYEYLFTNDLNDCYDVGSSDHNTKEKELAELNANIRQSNEYIEKNIKNPHYLFKEILELNQDSLTAAHRQWVMISTLFRNEIGHPPKFWHDINNTIHHLENNYYAAFVNRRTEFVPETLRVYIKPEDCQYTQGDLTLAFMNLGRHQYDQWLINCDVNEETNNYERISSRFEYRYQMRNFPDRTDIQAPAGYVKWCNRQNVPVLAPWISIGSFSTYDRNVAKQVMHKNLTAGQRIGFYE